jgi:hypothetical protein
MDRGQAGSTALTVALAHNTGSENHARLLKDLLLTGLSPGGRPEMNPSCGPCRLPSAVRGLAGPGLASQEPEEAHKRGAAGDSRCGIWAWTPTPQGLCY